MSLTMFGDDGTPCKPSAAEMEAYVWERWEIVYDHGGPSYPEMPTDGGDTPTGVRIKGVMKDGYFVKFEDMQAAYDFTLQREREIVEVEEEIEFQQHIVNFMTGAKGYLAFCRTLTRLQAIRAELGKGMVKG